MPCCMSLNLHRIAQIHTLEYGVKTLQYHVNPLTVQAHVAKWDTGAVSAKGWSFQDTIPFTSAPMGCNMRDYSQ